MRFVALNKFFHGLKEVKAELRRVGEELMSLCGLEDPGGKAFLNQIGASAIFVLVELGQALALDFQQRPRRGRPSQHGRVCEVEHVMEAIVVFGKVIVGKAVAEQDPARFLKDEFLAIDFAFVDLDTEQARKLFVNV